MSSGPPGTEQSWDSYHPSQTIEIRHKHSQLRKLCVEILSHSNNYIFKTHRVGFEDNIAQPQVNLMCNRFAKL